LLDASVTVALTSSLPSGLPIITGSPFFDRSILVPWSLPPDGHANHPHRWNAAGTLEAFQESSHDAGEEPASSPS
jgi:hypothetical protein